FAAGTFANFGFKSGTRVIDLPVSLSIPKFAQSPLRMLANFGIGTLAACVLLAGATSGVSAQAWPTRTVKVVVPYAPGGVTDTMARVTADRLGKMLGQTFFIETKPGAGGFIRGPDSPAF